MPHSFVSFIQFVVKPGCANNLASPRRNSDKKGKCYVQTQAEPEPNLSPCSHWRRRQTLRPYSCIHQCQQPSISAHSTQTRTSRRSAICYLVRYSGHSYLLIWLLEFAVHLSPRTADKCLFFLHKIKRLKTTPRGSLSDPPKTGGCQRTIYTICCGVPCITSAPS